MIQDLTMKKSSSGLQNLKNKKNSKKKFGKKIQKKFIKNWKKKLINKSKKNTKNKKNNFIFLLFNILSLRKTFRRISKFSILFFFEMLLYFLILGILSLNIIIFNLASKTLLSITSFFGNYLFLD